MKKIFVCLIAVLMVFSFAGCGSDKAKQDAQSAETGASQSSETQNNGEGNSDQTVISDQNQDGTISVATNKSVKLPEAYPKDKFPLYEGSYIEAVIETQGSYTLTAFSKDEVEKVIAFYEKVLEGANVISDTKTDESFTSFGTKDGYAYTMDVGKSSEKEGYQTSIAISIQPAE